MAKPTDDIPMYSIPDDIPDLVAGRHLCGFCRQVIGVHEEYCGSWCEAQDNSWWWNIHRTVSAKDPQHGRQWLTLGGSAI